MARKRMRLARLALVVVAAVVAASSSATTARAGMIGGTCSVGTQVFAPWGDTASYYLAPNGGLEGGASGWTLSGGAAVVSDNEPFLGNGTHALALPSGSSATSPAVCIGPNDPFVRMFGADAGGADSGLRVRVIWYGLLNRVLGVTDFTTFAPGSPWAPTSKLDSTGGFNLLVPLLGSTSARIQLVPMGSGSNWRVDDVYIDPFYCR